MAEFPVVDPPGIDQAPDEGVSRDIGIVAGKCKREMFVVFEGCEAQRNVVRGHPVRKREPQPYDIAGTPGTAQAEGGGGIAAFAEAQSIPPEKPTAYTSCRG